jgi:LacI family transcriptional regulator
VIQSTRQGVGRQIASMVRRLIAGDDLASLQVLWQPEFIPAKPPDFPPVRLIS